MLEDEGGSPLFSSKLLSRERESEREKEKDDDNFDASDFWKVLDDGIIIIVKVVVGGR